MDLIKLKHELDREKDKIGLIRTILELNQVSGNSFSAGITFDFKRIFMNYGVDLDLVPDKETESFVKKKKVEDPEKKLSLDILEHEAGHRENPTETKYGCPHTVKLHDRIKDAITRGLKENGKQGLEGMVTNAFEDVIDNVNCRRKTDYAGQTLFWNNQGLLTKDKYSPFYEAFVKINLILGGSILDANLLRRFYTSDDKIKTAVKTYMDYFKRKLRLNNAVKLHEKPQFETLFNKDLEARADLWEDLAYNFATNLADLLDKPPKEKMFG
ncbi:hypothetical protein GOV06_04175, partial [Candidatus Woesearchaeota archaeon]|nr:hypothetical protein [Candidatus Woesearchaeota archaeon]